MLDVPCVGLKLFDKRRRFRIECRQTLRTRLLGKLGRDPRLDVDCPVRRASDARSGFLKGFAVLGGKSSEDAAQFQSIEGFEAPEEALCSPIESGLRSWIRFTLESLLCGLFPLRLDAMTICARAVSELFGAQVGENPLQRLQRGFPSFPFAKLGQYLFALSRFEISEEARGSRNQLFDCRPWAGPKACCPAGEFMHGVNCLPRRPSPFRFLLFLAMTATG